jgi:hypothetical protein
VDRKVIQDHLDALHRLSKRAFWDSLTELAREKWMNLFDRDGFGSPNSAQAFAENSHERSDS